MPKRFICIHGHFYQPPRENPWTQKIDVQESAAPYHDWNERINAECYLPNAQAQILDNQNRPVKAINNYSRMSFNFGPTLLSWMKAQSPETYRLVLEADKLSQEKFSGHGSAIAQAYSHMIMPLANDRDKETQVLWGIEDFRSHFQRTPVGMWLPETAVDIKTLEALVSAGVIFTILAPHQALRIRGVGEKEWEDIGEWGIDTNQPYFCRLPSGKSIVIFFYAGSVSHDVAFGKLLKDGEYFLKRLMGEFESHHHPQIVNIATDGETYGHHHKFSEMALSYLLNRTEALPSVALAVYSQFLENNPPSFEVEIKENTSWSCVHGVERWRSNCGCRLDPVANTSQQWREPLRQALDYIRDAMASLFEAKLKGFGRDPWAMRNRYIMLILDPSSEAQSKFFQEFGLDGLPQPDKNLIIQLLEMQKYAMLMYTSCGWFFDDIGRIETVQILQYAARAMEFARDAGGISLEDKFLSFLLKAESNDAKVKNGRIVYDKFVKPLALAAKIT